MAGGLFAINREWFNHLGAYDPDFEIWGGENIELSLKLWMCGGQLLTVPCSHVGHIFRKKSPIPFPKNKPTVVRNTHRVAEVWLDPEYRVNYYNRVKQKIDIGDISKRVALREKLQCKSFKWYLDNIYPELFVPSDGVAMGQVKNMAQNGKYCLDDYQYGKSETTPLRVYQCHNQGGPQDWGYSKFGEIVNGEKCVDFVGHGNATLQNCHSSQGNQRFIYDDELNQIRPDNYKGTCLGINGTNVIGFPCDPNKPEQQWKFAKYFPDRAKEAGLMPEGQKFVQEPVINAPEPPKPEITANDTVKS